MVPAKYERRLQTAVTIGALLAIGACARAFMVVDYPVSLSAAGLATADAAPASARNDAGDAGAAGETSAGVEPEQYWSAYARLESRDIPTLWKASRQDYVLISARITLPTQSGPMERDLPLFTIDDGQVHRQEGFDLLQRFPLSSAGRDQVVIKLELRFLESAETLATVRAILAEAAKAAQPYLGQYAVASKILGATIPMIDRLPGIQEQSPSSAAFALIPEDLNTKSTLQAFLLFPFEPRTPPRDLEDAGVSLRSFARPVYPCKDFRGRLCTKVDASYEETRVHDVVYLTIEFVPHTDIFDPAVLMRGSHAHCGLITQSTVDKLRTYLVDNGHLFSVTDVTRAQHNLQMADDYLALRAACSRADLQALQHLAETEADQYGEETNQSSWNDDGSDLTKCWDQAWERTPAVEVWQAWSLYRTRQRCPRLVGESALRADLLHGALAALATIGPREFSAGSAKVWEGMRSPILDLLQGELVTLRHAQQARDFRGEPCKSADEAQALADQISVYCDDCWKKLAAVCPGHRSLLTNRRELRRVLVRPMLESVRKPDSKGPSGEILIPECLAATSSTQDAQASDGGHHDHDAGN